MIAKCAVASKMTPSTLNVGCSEEGEEEMSVLIAIIHFTTLPFVFHVFDHYILLDTRQLIWYHVYIINSRNSYKCATVYVVRRSNTHTDTRLVQQIEEKVFEPFRGNGLQMKYINHCL